MEHDNSDDPWGFWNDEPTRPLKRAHVGTRAHGETGVVPVVRAAQRKPDPEAHRPRNPLMTRVCVMVGVMLLCVPIALTFRQDKQQARAAEVQGVDTVLVGRMPPAPTDATVALETAAPTTILITTTALATTAAPATPAPTEAALATAAPTEPPITVKTEPPTTVKVVKKKVVPKTTTTAAPPPLAAATQSVAKAACTQTYMVASGDAWSTIAARTKVSMTSLLAANNATTQTVLLPGKKICLPAGAVTPAPPTTKPATTQPATTQPKATVPATTQPKTPPATTVPATTQPAPPPNTYSKAAVAQIIRDVWPDDLEDQAITIATRESNLIPTVHNYCCYGLFQIYFTANKAFLAGLGITNAAQLYDPRVNATAALALYNHSGWAPWALPTTPTTSTVVLS